jgi:hypothetical protein
VTNHFTSSPAQRSRLWAWIGAWLVLLAALAIVMFSRLFWSGTWLRPDRGRIRDVLLIVLVAVLAYLTRRIWLILNAARARTVEITAQGPIPGDALAAFREALTSVYLSSPSAVPGQSAPQDFLSDVREVATAKSTWGVILLAITAVVRLRAYRVSCTAREDTDDGLKSLTVEVISGVTREIQVTTVCERAWEDVVRRAACHVAAFVLPRTWQARQPPWTPWRRQQLDPDLFYYFQEARRLARSGRLEESLSHFDKATALDPLNPYIRIEQATVMDELGLYIDALATYVDVVTTESWYDRPVWKRYRELFADRDGWDAGPRRRDRSPHGPAALELARYRVVCSLAASQRLVEQWHRHTSPDTSQKTRGDMARDQPERSREARRVIATLRPLVGAFYRKMLEEYGEEWSPEQQRAAQNMEPEVWHRRVMQYAALLEARHLERDYRWNRPRRWQRSLLISQSAIRILPVWANLQFRYVEIAQERAVRFGGKELSVPLVPTKSRLPLTLPQENRHGPWDMFRQRTSAPIPGDEWPPAVETVKASVRWSLTGRATKLGWLEHYNGACAFAVAMLTPELYEGPDGRPHFGSKRCSVPLNELASRHIAIIRLAIGELAKSVTASDSQFAGISPWLRRGDQDLDDLRVTESYATFVDRYLSPGASWPPVPPNVARLTMSAHVLLLVQWVAGLRQALWEERAEFANSVAWGDLAEEAESWRRLLEYCTNYRDWRTRYRFIALGHALCPPGSRFESAIPVLEYDTGWREIIEGSLDVRTQQVPELPRPADSDHDNSAIRHTQNWLSLSFHLDRAARQLIESRNEILARLAESLANPHPLGDALAQRARDAQLAGDRPPTGTSVLLANVWQAISKDASLCVEHDPQADVPQKLRELRGHFGLAAASSAKMPAQKKRPESRALRRAEDTGF